MMEDPPRWRDGDPSAPAGTREILRAVSAVPPAMPETVRSASAAFVAGLGPAKAGLGTGMAAKAVVALVLAASGGALTWKLAAQHGASATVRTVSPAVAAPAPEPRVVVAPPTPHVEPPAPPAAQPVPHTETPVTRVTAAAVPSRDVARELESARALLSTDPGAALAVVQRLARDPAARRFEDERAFLAVRALHRLGRTAAFRSEAQRFLLRRAGSIYAPHVRTLLESSP